MITAQAHSEPARQRANPQRQLARYLMQSAGQVPRATPRSLPSRALTAQASRSVGGTDRQALAAMQRVWEVARGYFPGREMPVPRFSSNPTAAGVGWANGQPVGIRWDRNSSRALTQPRGQFERDSMLRNLLHEWAHTFQRPELHSGTTRRMPSGDMVHPRAEGGAEAFAVAVAPRIAAMLGQSYDRRDARQVLRINPYRPFVQRAAVNRGMPWILRGQFGG